MAREQVRSIGISAADPDAVWAIARDFCDPWHPVIQTMKQERAPDGGMIRAFTVSGEDTVYRERLTYFSDSDRSLAYTHIEGISGVQRYDARLTVTAAEKGGSVVTMSADLDAYADRAAAIAAGTKAIFDQGVAALATLAETAVAPAQEQPTPDAAPVSAIALDDLPRLALNVTPERDGPLCLFLHGIGGARSNWDTQLPLVGAHMQAAALDLRGYGDSSLGPAQTTIDDYCADILRVRQALGADKLILCGLSYGSWIATSFAMRHPEMLSALVLSGGCTGMSEAGPDEREAFRVSRETPLDAGQVPADFAPAVVEVLASPNAAASTREALRASMAAIPAATYRDALNCFTNPPERFDFARLSIPVLMMTGEHDRLAPPTEIRGVAGRIYDAAATPDVRFEVIAGAGHVCNVEDPAQYNAALLQFLKRVIE